MFMLCAESIISIFLKRQVIFICTPPTLAHNKKKKKNMLLFTGNTDSNDSWNDSNHSDDKAGRLNSVCVCVCHLKQRYTSLGSHPSPICTSQSPRLCLLDTISVHYRGRTPSRHFLCQRYCSWSKYRLLLSALEFWRQGRPEKELGEALWRVFFKLLMAQTVGPCWKSPRQR